MSELFGATRTKISSRHALIAEDGHVPSALPGFQNATPYFLISPALGAGFTQLLIRFDAGGRAAFAADETETALYVQAGKVTVKIGSQKKRLGVGGYAFASAGQPLEFSAATKDAAATLFRKKFEPLAGFDLPSTIFGNAADVKGQPFLGNPRARLKVLLPDDLRYDFAMNVFTYEPGATLPFVETHLMEHGLLMLEGQGIYRLEESYYPVTAGDVIWMAPYCPQWFVAMGDAPASYLYSKNVNRFG